MERRRCRQAEARLEAWGCEEEMGALYLEEGEGWNAAGPSDLEADDGVEGAVDAGDEREGTRAW